MMSRQSSQQEDYYPEWPSEQEEDKDHYESTAKFNIGDDFNISSHSRVSI